MTWDLAIDFGTMRTSAAWRLGLERPWPVDFGDGRWSEHAPDHIEEMPSAVLWDPAGHRVGRAARAAGMPEFLRSAYYLPYPKQVLNSHGATGQWPQERVLELVGAALAHVADAALTDVVHAAERADPLPRRSGTAWKALRQEWSAQLGDVLLLHPPSWPCDGPDGRDHALLRAWHRAGVLVDRVRLISEPVAQAHWLAQQEGFDSSVPTVIVDLGAGGCDVTVLAGSPAQTPLFQVMAHAYEPIGGLYLDHILVSWVRERLVARGDDAVDHALDDPANDGFLPRLHEEARDCKEYLAEGDRATDFNVRAGRTLRCVQMDSATFHQLARRQLVAVRHLLERALSDAGVPRSQISVVHLFGGSAQIPGLPEALGMRTRIHEHLYEHAAIKGALLLNRPLPT